MKTGCDGEENEIFACTCNKTRRCSNTDEVSQPAAMLMPTKRRVTTTATLGNNSRVGTHFLWRHILAVLLLTMMIENYMYESKRGVAAADGALPLASSRTEKYSTGAHHNADKHDMKDEIHDDYMYTNLDLDLDFGEGGNNDKYHNARNTLEREEDKSHEVLKIKRDFDTKVAESVKVEDSRYFSLDDPASNEVERYYDDSQDIIVIATVDGTFYGISRSTGQTIWKRRGVDLKKNNSSSAASENTDGNLDHRMQVNPSNGARQPHQTVEEYESIAESKSVEVIFAPLTSTSTTKEPDTGGRTSYRKGRTMAIPSVDGRVFISSGRNDDSVDDPQQENGEQQPVNDFLSSSSSKIVRDLVIRSPFVDAQGRIYIGTSRSSAAAFDRDTGEILSFMRIEGGSNNSDETFTPFGEEQKNIVWVGRVDYSVSVFSSLGDADVKFSSSEVLSMDDMAKRQGSFQQTIYNPALIRPIIVATPGGKLAMVDSNSDEILWIADETFDTPVVYALESKYGTSLRVDIIPDAPVFSKEYVSSMDEHGGADFNTKSMVWAHTEKGLFAVPIGRRRNYNGLPELTYSLNDLENGSKAIFQVAGHQRCNPDSPFYTACLSGVDNKSWFHIFLMSWFPPAIAFAVVVAFEMGRRSRAEKEKTKVQLPDGDSDTPPFSSSDGSVRRMSDQRQGAIKLSDEVLGYGGHGTIVYRGELDGRHVAVKRMLKAYHASAEREISLLIESDGHPHVVRYFLKEARGDFVYLALELCEMTLEDLIAALRQKTQRISLEEGETGKSNSVLHIPDMIRPMKETLFEVAKGVRHIHSLRIVHRDLKPQNILLAKKARGIDASTKCTSADSVYCAFKHGEYSPKISDMGLGKQLTGQSSFGLSTFNNSFKVGDAEFEEPLIRAGPGPGTVGWQAPEVMVQRPLLELSAASSNNNNGDGPISMIEASPIESSLSDRTSRSVDIFSLGCIFHYSLLPGFHPFGEWYERESNIMKNCPSLKALDDLPLDASDLIKQMINRKPSGRPNASQVCNHLFFWTETKRLNFVCDLSDRVEHDAISKNDKEKCLHYTPLDALLIEQQAANIVGTAWGTRLDQGFFNSVTKFRMYDQSSVRDLLRLIRNKHHHFDDLPLEVKEKIVSNQEDLMNYFESKFPRLLMHCYNVCCLCLTKDDPLLLKYDIQSKFQPKNSKMLKGKDSVVSCAPEQQRELEKPMSSSSPRDNCSKGLSKSSKLHYDTPCSPKWSTEVSSNCNMEDITLTNSVEHRNVVRTVTNGNRAIESPMKQYIGQSSVIAWEGSTTSSTLGCRGWMRSEDEWIERTDTKWGKVDANLIRGAQDQIFRTRLCNHWDMSQGAFCSIRKKNRCVFAHGPVELRVKEGKKGRWGRLVDLNGNNSNPFHSGGEDTYGAAKSIETVRKEEGKWKSPKKGKQRGKDSNSAGRKKKNLNK